MDNDRDRRVAGLILFMLGGLAGTALALRWTRRGEPGSINSTLQGVQAALDETVDTVESSVSYLRRVVAPMHELLEEANALAAGIHRTVDSYRAIGRGSGDAGGYVPSMAPERPGAPS